MFLDPTKSRAFKLDPQKNVFTFSPYLRFIGTILRD
jgi:hypothetical protein